MRFVLGRVSVPLSVSRVNAVSRRRCFGTVSDVTSTTLRSKYATAGPEMPGGRSIVRVCGGL